ncbi:hypothetical protein H0I54_14550 [Yersinia kristensenii]|uniref:hypothetical protein n=1 Tax=Yersinia kristensenii TaxID=28152 RepID=UPI001C60AD63|nr:hypothetical protein [Yersinia kristensenii]MBW5843029.1 hypothetical protein [Yersinia kristensenii]
MERILNKFGYFKRKKAVRQYKKIEFRTPGAPEENSQRLIELTVQSNEWARNKGEADYQLIGMFFTIVLLIEHKMINLLAVIDESIESRMLGEKIYIFKDFLKMYEPEEDESIEEYHLLIQPLNEIKSIRNSMAHDITQPIFGYGSLKQVDSYVKKRRPDMHARFKNCEDEKAKCMGLLATFGFIFSFEIAKLRLGIEHQAYN